MTQPHWARAFPLLAVVSIVPAFAQTSVSGIVQSDQGAVVTDAIVSIAKRLPNDGIPLIRGAALPGVSPTHGPVIASVHAGTDGSFSIPIVAAGQYVICAQSASMTVLDTCFWSTSALGIQTGTGVPAPSKITMKTGAVLQVHLNDTTGALNSSAGIKPRDLELSIGRPFGPSMPLRLIASSSVGRDYSVVIPFDTPLNLYLASSSVKLTDATGKALAGTSTVVPVNARSGAGATPLSLTFNVLGAR